MNDIQTCEHQCNSNCRRNRCNCNCGEYHIEIPLEFKTLLVGKDLKTSYLCAWNADKRSPLEENFIKYCDENKLIDWN